MALTLNAEQKSIFEIFSGKNQYIIPPYQRPYRWSEAECLELFEDLKRAYIENKQEGYFLGNIVIAKSLEEKTRLEVIDGQQRLTTLILLIKVLAEFDKDNIDLKNAIYIPGGRKDEQSKQRLKTNVFIEKDAKYLEEVLSNTINTHSERDTNGFKKNLFYFYKEVESFSKEENIQDFIDFFMFDVSLLPIQTEDSSPEKAREKALKIFETINNRGLNLSDSDIFKATLYSMALEQSKHDEFIEKWKQIDEESQALGHTINDIFRFYTQIIRGQKGITKTEVGLREFFTQEKHSPLKKMDYETVLKDLFKILQNINFFRKVIESPKEYKELTKWFQLIEKYTNQYPLNTLLVYMYVNGTNNHEQLIDFSKNLVRYAYYHGSTSKIKFPLFGWISTIAQGKKVDSFYPDKVSESDFEYLGLLKKGYALLCLYLNKNQDAIYPNYFSKIIQYRDIKDLNNTWADSDYNTYSDTLGNMIVVDKKVTRDMRLAKKKKLFSESKIDEVKQLAEMLTEWSYDHYQARDTEYKKRLKKFFENSYEN